MRRIGGSAPRRARAPRRAGVPRHARADAFGALALYLLAALGPGWLLAPPSSGLLALGAGLLVVGVAAGSVLRRRPLFTTAADRVTLVRAALGGLCAAATVLMAAGELPARGWPLSAVAALALALDAVDGWTARRTGTSTEEGARLDMEADAALLLVLSCAAALSLGPWVLAVGLMRYAFLLAGRLRPALRGELGFSRFRRGVAALQGAALLTALIPAVPLPAAEAAVAAALTLLTVSFGRDVLTLERRAAARPRAHARRPRLP
jgi:phosphatidylglycerophosphate synthase